MKIIVIVGVLLVFNYPADSSLLDPVIENVRHIKATHPPGKIEGMWKKKMLWKPRWIKEWKSSNVLKPIWRKFWGPVIIREWVPIPKPPPQWDGHSIQPQSIPPGTPFIDPGEPPVPNFGYLSAYSQNNLLNSGKYQSPPLPITSGFNSQAESYAGHSSYQNSADSSAFDLNPPVEQYNSQQPDYGYKGPSGDTPPVKPVGFSSHVHRHHHHYHAKPIPHVHNSDPTRFPPNWISWHSTQPNPFHSLAQQGSSPVSVVSTLDTSKTNPPHASPPHFQPGENDFIQQAALVSEYHYTEPAPKQPVRTTPLPLSPPSASTPVPSFQHGSFLNNHPQTTTNIQQGPPPLNPRHRTPVLHQKPVKQHFPTTKVLNHQKHSASKPQHKLLTNKTAKPIQLEIHKVPDFKALPSSVETFHFIEPFPSNQTLTRAALVGNVHQTEESNQISIISPKQVSPFIAKLAEVVVQEHLKNTQKANDSIQSTTSVPVTSTRKTKVTVIYPTTSSSSKKTLKALANESISETTTDVFIVTPLPTQEA